MAAIETTGLTKTYDGLTALDGLDLSVEEGELFGFIGPNGAGKTTTLNLLTGQIRPTSGGATVLGTDPATAPVEVRRKVGIVPERESPPSFLTPREYFEFVAEVRGIADVRSKVEEWSDRLRYRTKLDTLNADLSKGEKQKVMVTQAFLHEPDLVFIDEPLINLDPLIQERVKEFLIDYNEEDRTVFLSTHVMSLAEDLCDRVVILNEGRMIADRTMDEIEEDGKSLSEVFISEVESVEPLEADDH